jgi:quercetin dioxygenase-like cupin family protein
VVEDAIACPHHKHNAKEHDMSSTTIQAPVPVVHTHQGEARWWWGNLAILKLTGEHTHCGLTVVELTMGPGRMTPPHVHHREDETFLVTRGRLTFQIGDQTVEAGPGDLVVGPRDVPHRFTAGPEGASVLFLLTPAGLEGLILEQSVPASDRRLPEPGEVPAPGLEHMREVALRYGCELLA